MTWKKRGLWLRGLFCWLIGMTIVLIDKEHDYDLRFKMRGTQSHLEKIVIVEISRQSWLEARGDRFSPIRPLKEVSQLTDSFYWHPNTWELILEKILADNPLSVGVSLYFGENIRRPSLRYLNSPLLTHEKVVWSAALDQEGRLLPSRFARSYSPNAGLNDLVVDRDGVTRRFMLLSEPIPHLATQLLKFIPEIRHHLYPRPSEEVINFRGEAGTFKKIGLQDLLDGNYAESFFKDKIVIVGGAETEGQNYITPVGSMTRSEIIANVTDNLYHERWVERLPLGLIALYLLAIIALSVFIVSSYPHKLSLIVLSWLSILSFTLSLWSFDQMELWIPALAPVASIIATYIIFLSFQLSLKDYMNVQLEKERRFLIEVETLKNNFLSLISHDLKTPLAKIQGICDRLLAQTPNNPFATDLVALREEASELHRYIKTILQMAQVESRNFRINKDAADLNEVIESVIVQLRPLAKAKNIEITSELEPMFLIEFDSVLIHEVVLNLIENAIKYTPSEGMVHVSSEEVDDQVFVVVQDTGPGISKEEQGQIFQKFFRGELGKSQPKGSGLGLYLVKYFIELHKGTVFLESDGSTGTKVGFTLPILTESNEDTIKDTEDKNNSSNETIENETWQEAKENAATARKTNNT